MEHPIVGQQVAKKKVWYHKLEEEAYEVAKAVLEKEGDARVISEVLDVLGVALLFQRANPALEGLWRQENERRAVSGKTPVTVLAAPVRRPIAVPWIFGPCYAGKSTLTKMLKAQGYAVTESDEQWAADPGAAGISRRAWREEHPQHGEWDRVNAQHKAVRLEIAESGSGEVIVAHDPPPYPFRGVELRPSEKELAERAIADVLERGRDGEGRSSVLARMEAMLHGVAKRHRWEDSHVVARRTDEALMWVVQHGARRGVGNR